MAGVLDRLPPGARVAVVRLRSLGDCVLTTPALHILKSARPDLRVSVIVESRFAAAFTHNPDVDAIVEPAFPPPRADMVLNFHGGSRSLWLTLASLAPVRAGFGHYSHGWAYNVRIPRAQEILGEERKVHTAEHLASAIFYMGAPRRDIPRARLFTRETVRPGRYAVLHPIAARADKTWPAEKFLHVARHFAGDLDPVFIGGPGDDLTLFRDFRTLVGESLERIKGLLAGASFFVGNDSGPAHMAAAFGVPSVVIFGSSDRYVWAPWRAPAEVIAAPGPIAGVPEADVLDAIARLRRSAPVEKEVAP